MLNMIGQMVSRYRIVEQLGQGGMGVVYKAEDTQLGRFVALKFLPDDLSRDPLAVERFKREARAASSLNHSHICAVHDVGEHESRHFIVMELLEGATLQHHLGGAPLPVERVVEFGIQMADALETAHAKGIVHRDIKPPNVFITGRGQAKLLDFGLATSAAGAAAHAVEATTAAPLTTPGEVLGTVAYMSPEQVRGEKLDARTDLFSLGAVLYEMTTGRRAFAGQTSGSVHEAILNRAPVAATRVNPEIPARLDEIINKSLEKDRKLRYQSAADLAADLQRVKRDLDSARLTGHALPNAAPATRRGRRTVVVSLVVAVIALVAVATWLLASRRPSEAIDSVAVLPFVNAGGNPDTEYLSDGITESLINDLSQLRMLRVSARNTVFRYKGKDADPQAIGRDLGVRAVLSGRLLQRDNRVIVRTELIDVSDGTQLWGQEYNRASADVFVLQEQLSREISEKLRLRLTKEEQQQLARRYTDDGAAYELYLRGRYHWHKRNVQDSLKAMEYFNRAIERDPQYALAYAGLADALNIQSFFNALPPREVMPRAKAAATKALEIDDRLAEAHISLAYASLTYDWDWAAATSHFDRARVLNPTAVENHTYYPFYLTVGRRPDEAIRTAERALALDPSSASLSHNRAVQLSLAGRYDAAIEECRRTIELDPSFAVAYEVMAVSYGAKGRYRDALPLIEKASALYPDNAISLALLGYVRANLKQEREARIVLEQLTTLSRGRYIPALAFAVVHVGLDEKDQAFDWLQRAYDERANRLAYLAFEPTWERLRSDPRFDDLLRRIGLPR